MATPAQQFKAEFESSIVRTETLVQSFRRSFAEEQAKEKGALYISPRLSA